MKSSNRSGKRIDVRNLVWLLLPLSFSAIVVLFFSFRFVFEFDVDEGVNLIKSLLITQGSSLYTDIWSDQPPVFTYVVAMWIRLFGVNLTSIRLFMLLMSCGLLWAIAQYLRAFWGSPHALAGVLTLLLLPRYLMLSVSIMVGLPAIALAMLSFLAISYWHKERKIAWLILSGIALGLSMMTKLFTGFLVPIFLLGLIIQEMRAFMDTRSWRILLAPVVIWSTGLAIPVLLIGLLLIYPDGFAQLIESHVLARISDAFVGRPKTIFSYLRDSLPIIYLGVAGSVYVIRGRGWTGLYPIAWALGSFLLLSQHTPVWYHHQLLVTIPIAVVCGIAVGEFVVAIQELVRGAKSWSFRGAFVGITALLITNLLFARVPAVLRELDYHLPNLNPPEVEARDIPTLRVLELMWEYADVTKILITDRPMLAIRLGKPVPPNLAALTGKRLRTGELTEYDIISAIEEYQPEQVALARFDLEIVDAYLGDNYRLAYKLTHHRLYIRDDLWDPADPAEAP